RVCLRRGPGVARACGDRPRPLTSAPMNERILVVDDTPANIQTVAAILKGKGYQLSVATNGKQALDALTKIRPDLILLDVMMPELDGFETCQRIKSSEAWRDIPVIFLTAKTDTADIVKGFEMGAVDYVGKPFNAHELLARVSTHLTVDQLRRTLATSSRSSISIWRRWWTSSAATRAPSTRSSVTRSWSSLAPPSPAPTTRPRRWRAGWPCSSRWPMSTGDWPRRTAFSSRWASGSTPAA